MTWQRLVRRWWPVAVPWIWFIVRDFGWWFDALALVLPLVALLAVLVLGVLAFLWRSVRGAVITASWALFGVAAVLLPWVPREGPAPVDPVRLAAVNVMGGRDVDELEHAILAEHPDIVVVSEQGPRLTHDLGERYRWSVHPTKPHNDVAVFSDRPFRVLPMATGLVGQRGYRLEVEGPRGPFVLYAMHLSKPGLRPKSTFQVTFGEHRRLVAALAKAARHETLPVVVAGDLNTSDRTWGYRQLTAHLRDGGLAGWGGPTSERGKLRRLLLRIDHVFVGHGFCASGAGRFTLPGSDHRGLAATVGPCP